jgi:hypothetical protein
MRLPHECDVDTSLIMENERLRRVTLLPSGERESRFPSHETMCFGRRLVIQME